eukprot:CAMPEP_0206519954 /NCGR_PEP_ID=MMETSP0324_2-20121206/65490_1 /ASSEMBLY_ACC=CAM_ASM_000836 /TAXON_ID=2866 /ORGANISM="Crypthecodinium cohnii, Strain Seligo" /LENGTH=883 /DNA_ID=CAMNT_0054013617 /DNA_START=34 /DNA_END=2681 /DNA_ORIENTATION=+
MALRGIFAPFGLYGGLNNEEERPSESPTRLAALGAGEATEIEYEQFLKAKATQRAMFLAENKTIVSQCHDTDLIETGPGKQACVDGNQAAAHIAYALSDIAFIYPITPSSPMGEMVDEWAAQHLKNCYGQTLSVTEMSNMFKIAGELLPCVMHVAARALATQSLSIFGDHSDVMACRSTGWAMFASETVEMIQYHALISHLVTMECRVPIQHFFDGFRTSHEVDKIKLLDYDTIKSMIDWETVKAHHESALNPRHPHMQGQSQGPDIFFQACEAGNSHYESLISCFEKKAALVEEKTGHRFALYGYDGHPEAEYVIVVMGSGAVTCSETAAHLVEKGQKVGVLKVRLFRPWCPKRFLAALPATTKRVCVLDRTKEPGSQGEPLLCEVAATFHIMARHEIICVGGRYGLGSKEFTPNMVVSCYENLMKETPKPRFTVGITDDVTHLSLPVGEWLDVLPQGTTECMFYGLGSDGTVGANKSAVKLIALNTDLYTQAYFEYDAKKSGGVTISHLRFGPKPIKAPYNVRSADYIAIHKESYVQKYDMTRYLKSGGVCVVNCTWSKEEIESKLPATMKALLAEKKAKLFIIDATKIAVKAGLGKRINMIMQSVFFKLSGVMPLKEALDLLKGSIKKMYGKKGDKVVQMNIDGVDASLEGVVEIPVKPEWASLKGGAAGEKSSENWWVRPNPSEGFAERIQEPCNNLEGNDLPVSTFQPGGRMPLGTSQYEKRELTQQELDAAPGGVKEGSRAAIGGGVLDSYQYRIQVAPQDCTGCELCVRICPADALKLTDTANAIKLEKDNWEYMLTLPDRGEDIDKTTVKGSQFQKPYLEFSGACEGCGETPHVKLMTQLFGERLVIANATGCSSIWGASNPSFPYTVNSKGEGP